MFHSTLYTHVRRDLRDEADLSPVWQRSQHPNHVIKVKRYQIYKVSKQGRETGCKGLAMGGALNYVNWIRDVHQDAVWKRKQRGWGSRSWSTEPSSLQTLVWVWRAWGKLLGGESSFLPFRSWTGQVLYRANLGKHWNRPEKKWSNLV